MVRTVKSHQADDEFDDEVFVSATPDVMSQKVKVGGKDNDQKTTSALRSKHSETEQRRRSKINERFQILRDLIPEDEQKRDKASFLLEVIQYIQFLQEKIQMYEGSYQGWSQQPSKLMPWRSKSGMVENFVGQPQVVRDGSGNDDGVVATPTLLLPNAQNSLESELNGAPLYRPTGNSEGSGNHGSSLNLSVQPNLFDIVSSQPPQGSFPDPEPLVSHSTSDFWRVKPCASECAVPSYNASQREQLKSESGIDIISDAYSEGLLNNLTHALQSSGVDLSQTSVLVQLDVSKRTSGSADDTAVSTEDSSSFQQMTGYGGVQNYDRLSKKAKIHGS